MIDAPNPTPFEGINIEEPGRMDKTIVTVEREWERRG
jgi:hypothetical protein